MGGRFGNAYVSLHATKHLYKNPFYGFSHVQKLNQFYVNDWLLIHHLITCLMVYGFGYCNFGDFFHLNIYFRSHLREIRDRSVLRLFESNEVNAPQALPGGPGVPQPLPQTGQPWDQDQVFLAAIKN